MASLKGILKVPSCGMVNSLRTMYHLRHMTGSGSPKLPTFPHISASVSWLLKRLHSNNSEAMKVLTKSTMLLQDGSNIEELPILIRLATRDSYPFVSHTYSGGHVREESEFESTFKQELQNCTSVSQVFKLLEVPSDQVQGYCAAFALQRLHVLKHLNNDWNKIHSFIRSAVMRELYDTVQMDVEQLSNQTLITLVECYLAAEGFSPACMDAVNGEIQCRLADSAFSVEELLTLAGILRCVKTELSTKISPLEAPKTSSMTIASDVKSRFLSDNINEKGLVAKFFDKFCAKAEETREVTNTKCSNLLEDIWIHVGTRYNDMTAETLPLTMHSMTSERRNLISVLEKPISRLWPRLSAEGATQCLDSLFRLKVLSPIMMTQLGRWAYVNVHLVTPHLLVSFLNTFMYFKHYDTNIIRVIERCLSKGGAEVETDILALCVEYCRSHQYVSPVVMDTAAQHLTQNGFGYEPLQIFAVLRAFGFLNYLPTHPHDFLKQAERVLSDRFTVIEPHQLLEILGSFTFIGVMPHNFLSRINSDYFYLKISDLNNPNKTHALMWMKVLKHALVLSLSKDVDRQLQWVLSRKSRWSVFCYLDRQKIAIWSLKETLTDILGAKRHEIMPFYGCCTFYLDREGVPLEVTTNEEGGLEVSGDIHQKFAVILCSSDHFTANTRHLLGAQAQRRAQLEQLGFTIIEVLAKQFHDLRRQTLKEKLERHVNFSLVVNVPHDSLSQSSLSDVISKSLHLNWNNGEQGADFISDEEDLDTTLSSLNISKPSGSLSNFEPLTATPNKKPPSTQKNTNRKEDDDDID